MPWPEGMPFGHESSQHQNFPSDDDLGRSRRTREICQRYRDPCEIIEQGPLREKK